MSPRKITKTRTAEEDEVDVESIDPCTTASRNIDHVVQKAREQLELLTRSNRPYGRFRAASTKLSTKLPSAAARSAADLAPPRGVNLEPKVILQALEGVRVAPGPTTSEKAQQEQLAANELASRGYAVRTLAALKTISNQGRAEGDFENGNQEENHVMMEMQQAPLDLTSGLALGSTNIANSTNSAINSIAPPAIGPNSSVVPMRSIFTSGRVQKMGNVVKYPIAPIDWIPAIPQLRPAPLIDPMQPCMGSPAVGITVGIIPTEPLYVPQDELELKLLLAMTSGRRFQLGSLHDARNRVVMRKRGIVLIQPDRMGWRCLGCRIENKEKYNSWTGWMVHDIHQVGVLDEFGPMICVDCGRNALFTSNFDDAIEAFIACKRMWRYVNEGKIIEVFPVRVDCLCRHVPPEVLQAVAAAKNLRK
ncbi:hypothetical protein QAD02_024447 [Eretmocerus hayati]|uniref:Uncharacterized protein n=1 Tax=Eretmocerus hayati TaxID=131215 RepID=A0ACC2PZ28_9HYME|nr:hypothetical protein QAD02_024447 [Eretmocerus hayati]